ncbi:protein pangolin, isoforms A/H/I/S isoform X7 [Chironomus tepperi]|uniref:protein pangolin, isoforms A/H/I/S isoform X7 n=1 Tax=Chironomus tepperi TaxID=113505 RepID=UPI00391F749E
MSMATVAVRHSGHPSDAIIVPSVTSGASATKMPHTNHTTAAPASPGDDFGSTDEVKVFKDEGEKEDEQQLGENLLEEKSSLIDLTESEDKSEKPARQDSPMYGKFDPHHPGFNVSYLVSPYSYANGAAAASMANKIGLTPFFCHNGDHLTTPPPAHCGIPPYQIDPKTMGEYCLTRPALYPFPATQYPYPMLSPEMTAASWHTPSMYSAASSFRSPYPSSLPINTTLSRFSPTSLLPSVHPHHVLNSHPTIVSSVSKQESLEANHRYGRSSSEQSKNTSSSISSENTKSSESNDRKKPHIKKPLNAFMLYMKEMRAQVVAECTLKESAAINQILGRKWHSLSREEQSVYYEKARQERQLHMELYPGWSARDNYGYGSKKKKRKKDRSPADSGVGNSMKKCRARYGLDQQNQWCKPCRRKKKCIRYKESADDQQRGDGDIHGSDDNLGSCGSVDEAQTPDDDTESLNQSMSSPGGLSGLSSLQSPSTSLASPINLLASPSTPHGVHHHEENGLVASLVNQLSRNKWDSTVSKPKTNGMMSHDDHKRDHQQKNDVQIKTEPMDHSNSLQHHLNQQLNQQLHQHLHQQQQQQQHRLDPFLYDKLPIIRNPVGANPRDINNPLSVNQLTKRDFQPHPTGGYYTHPFQKPLMTHPLAHPHHLAQFHAASFANFQLAAAAAVQQNAAVGGKDGGTTNGGPHHRDDGNAISVT